MNTAFEQMSDFQLKSANLSRQCAKIMLDMSADLMRCYLDAAEQFCHTGSRFCQAQAKEVCAIAGTPSVPESVERWSSLVNSNLQGAAQLTQACVESAAGLQEPLAKVLEEQVPAMSKPILAGMENLLQAIDQNGKLARATSRHSASSHSRAAA